MSPEFLNFGNPLYREILKYGTFQIKQSAFPISFIIKEIGNDLKNGGGCKNLDIKGAHFQIRPPNLSLGWTLIRFMCYESPTPL